jgi:hypothetical protein
MAPADLGIDAPQRRLKFLLDGTQLAEDPDTVGNCRW